MRKSRFSEGQIIGVLREQESGAMTDACRRHGISEQTFYRWKAKYGGLEVSDHRRAHARAASKRESLAGSRTVKGGQVAGGRP